MLSDERGTNAEILPVGGLSQAEGPYPTSSEDVGTVASVPQAGTYNLIPSAYDCMIEAFAPRTRKA